MKSIKRGIAALLVAVLMIPNSFAAAAEASDAENVQEVQEMETMTEEAKEADAVNETSKTEEPVWAQTSEAAMTQTVTESAGESETTQAAAETNTAETETVTTTEAVTAETETAETENETAQETVKTEMQPFMTYNTGIGIHTLSDGSFKADGSYTIDIPEKNPFFPYEVQFTYDGETKSEWFMTPDDKVTVGGHDIYVDADFDNTVVTQMSLNVAGQTVVVYPEKKTFQDNKIADAYSLLPLEEKSLEVDLTGFTPVELTMVSFQSVFTGENALKNTDAVVWTYQSDDNYEISQSGDVIDLSYGTYSGTNSEWEMIVGIADQLEEKNVRYQVTVNYTTSREWLTSEVYIQDDEGVRTSAKVTDDHYDDQWGYNHNFIERRKYLDASSGDLSETSKAYVSMKVNDSVFNSVKYDSMKAFEGKYTKLSEIALDKDITDKLFCKDMTIKDAGYLADAENEIWITFVSYDNLGNATGCMPFNLKIDLEFQGSSLGRYSLFYQTESGKEDVSYTFTISAENGYELCTYLLYKEYPADGNYTQKLSYNRNSEDVANLVTAAYVGNYQSISEAVAAGKEDIKEDLFGDGYTADYSQTVYFSIFAGVDDDKKQEVYHRAFKTVNREKSKYLKPDSLFYQTESGKEYVSYTSTTSVKDGYELCTYSLYKEYPIDGNYTQRLYYTKGNDLITAAYVGNYQSISEAVAAGKEDIKEDLFGDGYTADYSQTVYFSIFVGADDAEKQYVYHYAFKTVERVESEPSLSSATLVTFTGLKDDKENDVACYIVGHDLDSYNEYSYLTIFVDKDVDLTKLAPLFSMSDDRINLYADDGTKQESGKNIHDFSKGPVQYSAAAENGTNSRNYWLQVVKAQEGAGQIYVNSFKDTTAGTKVENSVIHSKRELVIDSYHGNKHDILVANIGLEEIKELSAELKSDTLDIDTYWTFKGKYSLAGLNTIEKKTTYGELPNLAKIRLTAKDTVSAGDTLSGTLTIKSGSTTLAVLELTGTYGDPQITTKEIPQAVKYVPYGTMIQNNNKYSWNTVTYDLYNGKLPDGVTLKPNGELYGVPRETGEFQFTARLRNSASQFGSSTRQFTLTVIENTDKNVDNATDDGYDVTQRIPNVSANSKKDQLFVSKGEFAEFTKVFLDGEELEPEKDYTAESGSTRITIKSETIGKQEKGKHTLGVEFRTSEDDSLKRAAQNFNVGGSGSSGSSSSSSGSGSSSGSSSSSGGGSSSAGGRSSSHRSVNVTVTADSVMETAMGDVVYQSIVLPSDDAMLRLSFFNKIYGDNAVVLAYLDNGIGYSMNMNAFLSAGKDLNLSTKETELAGFAQGFKTIWLSIAEKTDLSYDLGINLTVGAEYANHPAYIYIFDDTAGIFAPYTQISVAENGNTGFYTRRLTDFVVMVAE